MTAVAQSTRDGATTDQPVLDIRNLTVAFGEGPGSVHAVEDVSLSVGAGEIWVTHGEAEALVHWCGTAGLRAKPLHLVGYGDEGEVETEAEAADAPA